MGNTLERFRCSRTILGPDDDETLFGARYETHFCPRTIGEGQFSKAYVCWPLELPEKRCALKVFVPEPDAYEHAVNEIRILQALGSHPRIISLVDVDADDFLAVRLVLELCEGGQLFDRIWDMQGYDEEEGATVLRNILEGVAFMHSRGIMHRDIKPENILLASRESNVDIRLCDFGTAKAAEAPERAPRSRSFKGSDFYLAPEVIRAEEYGPEIDIWAVGVTSYVVLSAKLPFMGDEGDLRGTYRKIVDRDLKFDGEAWEDASELATEFIGRMLSSRRDVRPSASIALRHPWLAKAHDNEETGKPTAKTSMGGA